MERGHGNSTDTVKNQRKDNGGDLRLEEFPFSVQNQSRYKGPNRDFCIIYKSPSSIPLYNIWSNLQNKQTIRDPNKVKV